MHMPVMSGLEIVKAYRFMGTRKEALILMLMANAMREVVEQGKEAGANAFLPNPSTPGSCWIGSGSGRRRAR